MTQNRRRAVVDIGSNTVRLVLFGGSQRAPVVLYNEKVEIGLGRGVVGHGMLGRAAMAKALAALGRFKVLIDAMDAGAPRVVATAAVRDAGNGDAFVAMVRELGLPCELLSGDEEALAAGMGVISAIPDAEGLVADLGGGSLELARVARGQVWERTSLPLGILSAAQYRTGSRDLLRRHLSRLVAELPWVGQGKQRPIYLVGGSWRSLARAHIHISRSPLPILSHYRIPAGDAGRLCDRLSAMDMAAIRAIPDMPTGRAPALADASALLAALAKAVAPSEFIVSPFGLREGLLFQLLAPEERQIDPLIAGIEFMTASAARFEGQGEALSAWLGRLFGDGNEAMARLRHAVCLLTGTGWASNPDFRALGGEEFALHGNWIGIYPDERAVMAMALYVGLGGSGEAAPALRRLARPEQLSQARMWGLALRLAQKLGGGAPDLLRRTALYPAGDKLVLEIPLDLAPLGVDTVRRRLDRLAGAMSLSGQIAITGQAAGPS